MCSALRTWRRLSRWSMYPYLSALNSLTKKKIGKNIKGLTRKCMEKWRWQPLPCLSKPKENKLEDETSRISFNWRTQDLDVRIVPLFLPLPVTVPYGTVSSPRCRICVPNICLKASDFCASSIFIFFYASFQ